MADSPHITRLLLAWRQGDQASCEELMPLVYDHLRKQANRYLHAEDRSHTLQPTALVHEAYIQLAAAEVPWQDRAHFYAVAARMMRRILVDHARAQGSQKRGGGLKVALDTGVLAVGAERDPLIVDLDEALQRLEKQDPRKSQVIELLYFGGLTAEETAEALSISTATVNRDLRLAKAWLQHELRVRDTE